MLLDLLVINEKIKYLSDKTLIYGIDVDINLFNSLKIIFLKNKIRDMIGSIFNC